MTTSFNPPRRLLWMASVVLMLAALTPADSYGGSGAGNTATTSQFSGTVVDEKGRPVADASVDCYQYPNPPLYGYIERESELKQHAVTDRKGTFTISAPPGETLVVVKKRGLAPAWKTWSSFLVDSSDPLVLTAPTTLAGVVVDEDAQPVAGAEVRVSAAVVGDESLKATQLNDLSGRLAQEIFSARTARDGRFRIENFPADGHAILAVRKPGKAQYPADKASGMLRFFRSGQQNIELRLGPPGAIEGKVTVQDSGQALAGVKLWLQPAKPGLFGHESIESFESGRPGTFRIPDVRPGTYDVLATMPGVPVPDWVTVPDHGQVTVVAGQTSRDVVVHAAKAALVEITVVATNSLKPLANVEVLSYPAAAYTGIDGVARLRIPPDRYGSFELFGGDWLPQQGFAGLKPGVTNHVQVQLIPAPRISGTVRDPSGKPAADVAVSFNPGHYPGMSLYTETRTDKNGRYELILQKQPSYSGFDGGLFPTNSIMARDLARNLVAFHAFEDIPTNLDLTLEPGIKLTGFLRDTEGAPVSNATINLRLHSGGAVVRVHQRVTTVDRLGTFSIPALPKLESFDFYGGMSATGYGPAFKEEDVGMNWPRADLGLFGAASNKGNSSAENTNRYQLPVYVFKRANRKLAGQVLDQAGKPLNGASVSFHGEGQPQSDEEQLWDCATLTDSKGRFVFNEVAEGDVRVSASTAASAGSPALNGLIQAKGGDTNIVLRLRSQ